MSHFDKRQVYYNPIFRRQDPKDLKQMVLILFNKCCIVYYLLLINFILDNVTYLINKQTDKHCVYFDYALFTLVIILGISVNCG